MHATHTVSSQTAMTVCSCGRYHLTYGPVTLHFEPTEFLLFAKDIARISGRLRQGSEPAVPSSIAYPTSPSFPGGRAHDN